tara:strand:+ start:950 stop:1507 length:558 start_codon:yes stop_codon:yes gene_type:complete
MDMNTSVPPFNFITMLNSLISDENIILRTEIINGIDENNNEMDGCSEEFKNNLEEFTIDEEFIKKDLQCSICLDDFKIGDKCISLPCSEDGDNSNENHVFHSGGEICSGIKGWLRRKNNCPMCRKEFPKEENTVPGPNNEMEPNINPNNLENTLTDLITTYINEIQETNEQREIQMAIEASLNDS